MLTPDAFQTKLPFLGLAPFLRMNVAEVDLLPIGQAMLARAQDDDDPNLLMNLSCVLLCLGQRDLGLAIQNEALQVQRVYTIAAAQPAKFRLLMLMLPGDLSTNIPLDCLLENMDIELILYYVSADEPLASPIPEHDALIVAISDQDAAHDILTLLEQRLADWPTPVLNSPQHIRTTERSTASRLLQNIPGLFMPSTLSASRSELFAVILGKAKLSKLFVDIDFPIILRPQGSHAGVDLDKIETVEEMANYLGRVNAADFFISRFIDYRGQDGLFRKYRVVLIDGHPYASHMAISSHWMIHYVNAGMYQDAAKREEEAAFMEHFSDFAQRHKTALQAMYERTQLDYFSIDCTETLDGQLFVFELDHAMVVHAMDPETLFPYKQRHILKAKLAFRELLCRITTGSVPTSDGTSATDLTPG